MALRSNVSSLSSPAPEGEMPAAPAPRLSRRPGMYKSPPGAVDVLSSDEADHEEASEPTPTEPTPPLATVAKPKAARKPRAVKTKMKVAGLVDGDAKATRTLINQVEGDLLDLQVHMQKAVARFQPKRDRLLARHAELSATLAKQLTQ